MVSPARRFEKLGRMESKILAYNTMISTGMIPKANGVIRFHEVRLGEQAMEHELTRAKQALFDLKADINVNLEKFDPPISWKDYIKTYHTQGKTLTQLGTILEGIEDPLAKPKKKKETVKDA